MPEKPLCQLTDPTKFQNQHVEFLVSVPARLPFSRHVMVRVKFRYIVSIVSVGGFNRSRCSVMASSFANSTNILSHDDSATIYKAIRRSVQMAHGTFGLGRIMARFRIIFWNPFSGLLIIRVLRGLSTEQMTSALSLVTSIHEGKLFFSSILIIHSIQ